MLDFFFVILLFICNHLLMNKSRLWGGEANMYLNVAWPPCESVNYSSHFFETAFRTFAPSFVRTQKEPP